MAYAEAFGKDPDEVFANAKFDTVMAITEFWKERREFEERYHEVVRTMETKPQDK